MKLELIDKVCSDGKLSKFCINSFFELKDKGLIEQDSGIHLSGKAIIAKSGKSIIGFIIYDQYEGGYWIYLSYVKKNKRRQGVYSKMYKKLRKLAKENNKTFIESSTHITNLSMRMAAIENGRNGSFITYKEEIKP